MLSKTGQQTIDGKTTLEHFEYHLKRVSRIFGIDNLCFGFSGGDDSAVLLDKAVEIFGSDIAVIFSNTHIQFQQTYKYIDEMIDYWDLTNVNYTKPNEQFIRITKRIGLHGIAHNKMICCSELKNDPLADWMKANGFTATVSGLRQKEGKRNDCYDMLNHNPRRDIWYVSPMFYLTNQDILDYFDQTGLPKNPLYCEPYCADRTGCAPCPNALKLRRYSKKFPTYYDWLKKHFPKWYKFAWRCQKSFYDIKCVDGDQRGYGDMLYRHKWQWSLNGNKNQEERVEIDRS
jgi:phosphoadenosine phosphosulfate reductase